MKDNQSGMTLVELLAVLVLISLVTGIIWTTMSISMKHNSVETTKLQLQQEANAVITKLQREHRVRECYNLNIEEHEITITNCEDQPAFKEILGNEFKYGPFMNRKIQPKKGNTRFNLEVTDLTNPKLTVTVPTEITRYKSE
ncbi:prepilin-type N-terminal cleavage/methylation domain-containing protein [Sporosarcina sp. BI001-red]|uniref:prepilin-type N-terminal cleavage/methylation domain-containing protein n=1 Tax=Sporosarcina sp. BI001-red TaxID=2282866 RepID=UPI000E27D8C4|nr:prepilin-type N-terminal cleavage/methylation domain-containing protein [Sporosarcina sp. BI001-red]REB07166.1 prepilin-type N-terminal cleavage/methylation domain-containing protein [Sporosarcina sp. BI001-red]